MAKKTRSLNDTSAIQMSHPFDDIQKHESRSTSVRKIDNGYIVSESSHKDGLYDSKESYSATPPNLGGDSENSMAKAIAYMKRNGSI